MPQLIKITGGGSLLEFDQGKFDAWCVYLTRPGFARYAPADIEYFTRLTELAVVYGHQQLYHDFVQIYRQTTARTSPQLLADITSLSVKYGPHAEETDMLLTVLYAGMVAEENKRFARLKKRIKRLGMHQLLIEKCTPAYAAHFSRGKSWQELDAIMQLKGF